MELKSIETIVRSLNNAGIRYLIVGGLAVNAHGFERMTRDLDLVIQLDAANILAALNTLAELGYKPRVPVTPQQFATPHLREQWKKEKQMLVLQLWSDAHRRTPVDIFVYEPFDFSAEERRALIQTIAPGVDAPIVALEALLRMKIEANRPQDLVDIDALNLLLSHRT